MITFAFSKYSGCGNDFVLVDNRSSFFPIDNAPLVRALCDRREGVGADGVILLETSTQCDFRMRIFNADGSEAEMCGNGIRCFMRFIQKLNPQISHCRVETMERSISLQCEAGTVRADVGPPKDIQWMLPNALEHPGLHAHFINSGVPHCVVFVSDLDNVDMESWGPKIRRNAFFGPKGTNVNFVQVANGHCSYRTWERGVEGETPACGTGAVAVAMAAFQHFGLKPPISVWTQSRQQLIINFEHKPLFSNVTLSGPATHIFDGVYHSLCPGAYLPSL